MVGSELYCHVHVLWLQIYMLALGGFNRREKGEGYSTLNSPGKSVPTVCMVGSVPFSGVSLSFTSFWFWEWVRFSLPWVLKQGLLQNRNINFCNSSLSDLFWLQFSRDRNYVSLCFWTGSRQVSGLESSFHMWYDIIKKGTYIIKCFLKKPYSIAVFVQTIFILFLYTLKFLFQIIKKKIKKIIQNYNSFGCAPANTHIHTHAFE